jgi:hypothetical protein
MNAIKQEPYPEKKMEFNGSKGTETIFISAPFLHVEQVMLVQCKTIQTKHKIV